MADGKHIEIKIAASGGDAAAAEVRKVEEATKALNRPATNQAPGFGGMLDGVPERAEQAKKPLEDLWDAAAKVTAANVTMGTGMKNVSSQVKELAGQLGSGTSAFRALGKQLPILLSGLGPMGTALGVVSAAALPLVKTFFETSDAAKDAAASADEFADKLEKVREKAAGVAAQKSAAGLKDFIESLDDEEQAIRRQNTALERQIELLKALRQARADTEGAQREAEIANIQADPNKTDAQKIREVAAVNERGARADAEGKLNDLSSNRRDAAVETKGAENIAADAARQAAAAAAKQAELEEEKKKLRGKVTLADNGATSAAAIKKQLADLETERNTPEPSVGGVVASRPGRDKEFSRREKELKEQLAESEKNSQQADPKDRARLSKIDPEITTAKANAKEEKAAAAEAERKVADARAKEAQAAELQKIQAPEIINQFTARSGARGVTAEAAANKAEEAAKRTADQEAAQAATEARRREQERLQDARTAAREKLKETAAGNSERVAGGVDRAEKAGNSKGADALKSLSKELGTADTDAEIKAARDKIAASQQVLGASIVAAMQKMLEGQDALVQKIKVLEGQIKNNNRK